MIALRGHQMERAPLDEIVGRYRPLDPDLYEMAEVLAEFSEEISYR